MGLESRFSYISDLSATDPAASDSVSQGDEHLRGIKNVLKTQFPSLGEAIINATAANLNQLVGYNSSNGTVESRLSSLEGLTSANGWGGWTSVGSVTNHTLNTGGTDILDPSPQDLLPGSQNVTISTDGRIVLSNAPEVRAILHVQGNVYVVGGSGHNSFRMTFYDGSSQGPSNTGIHCYDAEYTRFNHIMPLAAGLSAGSNWYVWLYGASANLTLGFADCQFWVDYI